MRNIAETLSMPEETDLEFITQDSLACDFPKLYIEISLEMIEADLMESFPNNGN